MYLRKSDDKWTGAISGDFDVRYNYLLNASCLFETNNNPRLLAIWLLFISATIHFPRLLNATQAGSAHSNQWEPFMLPHNYITRHAFRQKTLIDEL